MEDSVITSNRRQQDFIKKRKIKTDYVDKKKQKQKQHKYQRNNNN